MANPLLELRKYGQSLWYDNIRRGLITSGELEKMRDRDGLAGVTSNPTIFEKAISSSTDYDADIEKLVEEGKDVEEIYLELVLKDIQLAADILRPVYEATGGSDGFACLEVSPLLAYKTEASIRSAHELWQALDRPNVMIKIPGTQPGLPAIQQCLSDGININITLLFDVGNYEQVAEAYIAALEELVAQGKAVENMASVASFFVSRVDTAVDKQLDERIRAASDTETRQKLEGLLGKAGIANAKVAYQRFKEIFSGDRWQALAEKGVRVQRCLWASTGTKNPQYRDVMYLEGLIGPDTVNTMPQNTMDAFREHGVVAPTLEQGIEEAREVLRQLQQIGIDLKAITAKLQTEGVELFSDSHRKLLEGLRAKRETFLAKKGRRYYAVLGPYQPPVDERMAELAKNEFCRRLWARDASLWKEDKDTQEAIRRRLGWLTVIESMVEHVDQFQAFAYEVKSAGFRQALLLGMGGSSLAPEVFQKTFAASDGYPPLKMLDSTDPSYIRDVTSALDLEKTLFIVSSKSGTTLETLSLYKYFFQKVQALQAERAGENFVAITDAGTPLERISRQNGFRRCFLGAPDVGGRFSALSPFGLVPAAVIGVDVAKVLDRAEALLQGCASCVPPEENHGLWLGAILGELAKLGRDKVTFIVPPKLAPFAGWAEQLLAESLGKEGVGLVPITDEPIGDPSVYGDDRLFICLRLNGFEDGLEEKIRALEDAGQPIVYFHLADEYDLGQEFFRWEVATALVGSLFGINPFDEPNVQESKDNTARIITTYQMSGQLPSEKPLAESHSLSLYADEDAVVGLDLGADPAYLRSARPGDYWALMAYLPPSVENDQKLTDIRVAVRDFWKIATCAGYGPRYLHSTGQLHKGGPNNGVFLQITMDDPADIAIPGEQYGFSVLKQAQALGDLQSLRAKGRRIMRVHLKADVGKGLDELARFVKRP